jgi:hypothetical protein
MQEKIWMAHPFTGEKREVAAELEAFHPLMLEGWKQSDAPQSTNETEKES